MLASKAIPVIRGIGFPNFSHVLDVDENSKERSKKQSDKSDIHCVFSLLSGECCIRESETVQAKSALDELNCLEDFVESSSSPIGRALIPQIIFFANSNNFQNENPWVVVISPVKSSQS
jgi:hypothetical protein